MSELATVDSMLKLLQQLSDKGYGDMTFKCLDNHIYTDEVGIDFANKEIKFKGFLFNYPPEKKVKQFTDDVRKALDRFYHSVEELEVE